MKYHRFASFIPVSATSMGRLAITIVFIIAGLDLVGWLFDIPFLKSVNPHLTAMRIITAICFLVSAAALTCLQVNRFVRWRKRITLLSGAVVSAVGLLTIACYLIELLYTGCQWLWVNNPFLNFFLAPPFRMSIITAILFSLYGCILLLLGTGNRHAAEASHIVLLPVSMLSYLVVIGYLFNIKSLYTWLHLSIALNTSLAFWCLCVAAFCVRPDSWFMKVFTGKEVGSIMTRRLLPFLLFLPLLIGWLRLQGERLGFFGSEVGVAIVVVTYTVCFLLLVWFSANSVNRTDWLRCRAEERVRESEKRLLRAQEIAHLGSWELDMVNNSLSWSDEVYRIFGLKPQKFGATYEAFLDFVHPDDRDAVDAAYSSSLREGKDSYEIEHRIIRKSTGEIRVVHEKCDHIRDKDGKIIRSIGMVHDITERIQFEKTILSAKLEWERTFDSVPDLIALLDRDHRITRVNKAMAERLGRIPKECVGLYCYQEVHGTDAPPLCPHTLLLADGHEHLAEITEDRLGGTFLVSTTPLIDADGHISGSVHMARDITEIKKKENELHRINLTLKALNDSNHIMTRMRDEHEYLSETCRIIVEVCGYKMVWIGFAEDNQKKTVRPMACAGFEDGYLETLKITWAETEQGCGPTGTAIRTGKPYVCRNILTDPNFAPWREEAIKRGYASSLVLPLLIANRIFGALSIYSREMDPFSETEVELLSNLAVDLANGIEMIRLQAAQKKADELLNDERKFIDVVIKTTGGLIIGMDLQGRIKIFNNACEKTTGYSFDQVKDRPFWDFLLIAEEVEPVKKVFKNLTDGSFPNEFENYWVTHDGNRRFIRWTNSTILDAEGNVELIIGTGIDITERKQSEEELKRAKDELEIRVKERTADLQKAMSVVEVERQRFNDVLEMLPAYIVLLTTDYHVPFANRFFTERFGESKGKRCFEYLFNRTEPCENCETFKVLKTRAPHRWEWTGPDHRNYDVYDFLFPGADGQQLIMEMGIDITERKRAEAALLEANEMKLLGQLTSGVAHEVRNPLNGIMAIMGALSKELSDNERFQPYMQHMRNQVTRLTTLMEELLALGRPVREENMHEISMVKLVESAIFSWQQTLQTSRPSVRFIKPEQPEQCMIRADSTNMTQVIINLLENAYNHSPEGAETVCSVHGQVANTVVFYIKDSGAGIAEEILPRIFDPFFTTRKGGTGLGLSIVRHVVENHQGSVFAYNNTDGPGATFEVVLPLYIRN